MDRTGGGRMSGGRTGGGLARTEGGLAQPPRPARTVRTGGDRTGDRTGGDRTGDRISGDRTGDRISGGRTGVGRMGGDGPPSRRGGRPRSVVQRRRRRLAAGLLAALVVILILLAIVFVVVDHQINPPGGAGAAVTVNVPAGSSVSSLSEVLGRHGVATHPLTLRLYARLEGVPVFRPGEYRLHLHEPYRQIFTTLGQGPLMATISIPEGFTVAQIAARVGHDDPGHTASGFLAAAKSGQVHSAYQPPGSNNLEGLLFPATYQVAPDRSDADLLRLMVGRFDRAGPAAGLAQAKAQLGVSPYQTVTVASIIEREAKLNQDRGKVARVIYNRLGRGMALQVDATVLYGRGSDTAADRASLSPYNTYRVKGLPPTPIASPGQASLAAALAPTPGPWLYYCSTSSGSIAFSTTNAEQDHNLAGVCRPGAG